MQQYQAGIIRIYNVFCAYSRMIAIDWQPGLGVSMRTSLAVKPDHVTTFTVRRMDGQQLVVKTIEVQLSAPIEKLCDHFVCKSVCV